MEIRHLIVHNSGKIDKIFEKKYESKLKHCLAENNLPMSIGFSKRATAAIGLLCHSIDLGLTSKGYIKSYVSSSQQIGPSKSI